MQIQDSQPMNIKSWSPEDRPREKLLMKGTSSLSDAELIAILLRTGLKGTNVVEVAAQRSSLPSNTRTLITIVLNLFPI